MGVANLTGQYNVGWRRAARLRDYWPADAGTIA